MIDISIKISAIRQRLGLSQEAFAIKLGYTKAKVQNIEASKQRADHEFLAALAQNFSIDLNDLLGVSPRAGGNEVYNTSPEFIPIQRYDVSAAAGSGSLIGAELGTGYYAFNRKWLDRRGLQPKNLAVIAVRGDSMEPDLHDKDLILLDRSQIAPADGDIYVLRYSGMLFVKRVQVIPGNRAELRSTNPLYGPIIVTMETAGDDLAFIGRVVASMHEW